MLKKPGEARQKAAAPRNRRRVVEEDLEDVVRRLQRLPPNKSCADCSSKLTQNVNLNHGTFICTPCAGVHREFNHKIKGIGHSSFTPEEITKLRHPDSGNEAVNARYLAHYDPHRDRMKPPQNSNDLQLLRSWIQRKYIDKTWCDNSKGDVQMSSPKPAVPKSMTSPSRPSTSKSKSTPSKRNSLPRVGSPTPQPADPFGFDSFAPTSAPATDPTWDAFGGSSASTQNTTQPPPQPAAFQADFGSMASSTGAPPPVPPPAPPAPAFQADFGNFSQPTVVSLPPGRQMPQIQQQQQQQQQQPFQANFSQTPSVNQVQPQQQQQSFQANFDQASTMNQSQPNQHGQGQQPFQANFGQTPSLNQVQPQQQQQSFQANFDQTSTMNHSRPNQQGQGLQPFQANFDQTGVGNTMPTSGVMGMQGSNNEHFGQCPQQMQQHQNNNIQSGQSGFANFSSAPQQQGLMPQQQHQQSNVQNNQLSSNDFNAMQQQQGQSTQQIPNQNNGQTHSVQIQGPGMINQQGRMALDQQQKQLQQQQQQQNASQNGQTALTSGSMQQQGQPPNNIQMQGPEMMNHQGSFGSTDNNQQQSNMVVSENSMDFHASGAQTLTPPTNAGNQPGQDQVSNQNQSEQTGEMNPNALEPVADDKKSAFDAFDGLSLEPTSGFMESSAASDISAASSNAKAPPQAQFKEGQTVVYTNSDGMYVAQVMRVHFDDVLHPYYTINVNGRERQTEESRLCVPTEAKQSGMTSNLLASKTGAPDNTSNASASGVDASVKLQETVSMLRDLNTQQLMQVQQFIASIGMSQPQGITAMGMTQQGYPTSGSDLGKDQTSPHQTTTMGFSNQQGQMNMATAANVVQNGGTSANGGLHMQSSNPSMMPNNQQIHSMNQPIQQNQNAGIQQHSLQMGVNIGMGSAILGDSRPAEQMGGFSTMTPMGGAAPGSSAPAAPPPALPPVEKEGNPFDVY